MKSLKGFITEYIPDVRTNIYHKHIPLIMTVVYKTTFLEITFKTIT